MTSRVRGTQSFVAVMGRVWDRPLLSALEIAWRWAAGGLILWITAQLLGAEGIQLGANATSVQTLWQGISIFQPVAALQTLNAFFATLAAPAWPLLRWLPAAVFLLWNSVAALGRGLVLRRLDPALHARPLALLALGLLRATLLAGAWALWSWLVALAAQASITAPAARGEEPSLVLFAAIAIGITLLLYCAWAVASWPLYLAPLLAMQHGLRPLAALRAALAAGPVRGKLIEINLVLHIVKLAVLVLAMVFSASPLPFTTVATQGFLELWWLAVVLLTLAASDYFHVVRSAAYLSLYSALGPAAA